MGWLGLLIGQVGPEPGGTEEDCLVTVSPHYRLKGSRSSCSFPEDLRLDLSFDCWRSSYREPCGHQRMGANIMTKTWRCSSDRLTDLACLFRWIVHVWITAPKGHNDSNLILASRQHQAIVGVYILKPKDIRKVDEWYAYVVSKIFKNRYAYIVFNSKMHLSRSRK